MRDLVLLSGQFCLPPCFYISTQQLTEAANWYARQANFSRTSTQTIGGMSPDRTVILGSDCQEICLIDDRGPLATVPNMAADSPTELPGLLVDENTYAATAEEDHQISEGGSVWLQLVGNIDRRIVRDLDGYPFFLVRRPTAFRCGDICGASAWLHRLGRRQSVNLSCVLSASLGHAVATKRVLMGGGSLVLTSRGVIVESFEQCEWNVQRGLQLLELLDRCKEAETPSHEVAYTEQGEVIDIALTLPGGHARSIVLPRFRGPAADDEVEGMLRELLTGSKLSA
jgi:hypothetical protein